MKKFFTIIFSVCLLFMITTQASADQTAIANVENVNSNSGSSVGDTSSNSGSSIGDTSAFNGDVGSNNVSINQRGFVIPGDVGYGPLINYFGQPLPSEGFQPVEQIIMYACFYTEGALKSMLKGVEKVDAEFKVSNLLIDDATVAEEDGKTRWIKVVISKEKYQGVGKVGFKGFVTARSEHRDTTMVETMAKAALVAVKGGCNVIHFTAQGAVRDVESFGWGVGFNTTQANINGPMDKSNVTSGGLGFSKGYAGTRDKPWLQGFGLVDDGLEYPELIMPPPEEE